MLARTSVLSVILIALVAGCGSGAKTRPEPSTAATHARTPWAKVAPDLWAIIDARTSEREAAIAAGRQPAPDAPIEVRVTYTGDAGRLVAAGIPLGGAVSDVAQGGLTPEQIRQTVALEWVHTVSLPVPMQIQ